MWQIKYSNSSSKYIVIVVVLCYCFVFVIELWIEFFQQYFNLRTLILLHFSHFIYCS